MMMKLNLPSFDYILTKEKEKVLIFDTIRKKYIQLTPEEWVRQHLVNYLVEYEKYPKALMRVEQGLTYNSLLKRSDIAIYDRMGKPWMVIECKSPNEKLSKGTLRQVATYNTKLIAPFIAISNGLVHYVFEIDHEQHTTKQLVGFPDFPAR